MCALGEHCNCNAEIDFFQVPRMSMRMEGVTVMATIAENRELSGSAIVAICGGSGGEGALDRGNPMGGSGGGKARFSNDERR